MLARLLLRTALIAAFAILMPACQNFGKKKQQDNASADGDYVSGSALPERQEGVSFLGSNVDRSRFSPVYFGFDSYEVSSGEHGKISQVAEFLRSGGSTVIVAGFTDE